MHLFHHSLLPQSYLHTINDLRMTVALCIRHPFCYTTQPETLTQQGLSGHCAHRIEKGPSLPCSRRSRTSWALLSRWEAHACAAGSCCPPRCVKGCMLASRGVTLTFLADAGHRGSLEAWPPHRTPDGGVRA